MISRFEISASISKWIDKAKLRFPYDKELINDLWYMRDIVEEIGSHPDKKERLLERLKTFEQNYTTIDLRKLLEEHYAEKKL